MADTDDLLPAQPEFIFGDGGDQDGRENLRRLLKEKLASVQRTWRLPVGHRVSVELGWLDREVVGRLDLDGEPPRPDRRQPLPLKIGKIRFLHTDIVSCRRLDVSPDER